MYYKLQLIDKGAIECVYGNAILVHTKITINCNFEVNYLTFLYCTHHFIVITI
jgi:hypothetical protein